MLEYFLNYMYVNLIVSTFLFIYLGWVDLGYFKEFIHQVGMVLSLTFIFSVLIILAPFILVLEIWNKDERE